MIINRIEMGSRIKAALKAANINQKQLAEMIGVKPPSITAYIQGTAKVPDEALAVISNICKVSIDWLILGEKHTSTIDVTASADASEKPVTVAINGGSAHVDVHHHAAEAPERYGHDPVEMAFLNDWRSLTDVVKMRIWTTIKEEMERQKKEA